MTYLDGISAFRSGDYEKAISEFQKAIGEDDNNHKAWNALGVVFTKTGKYEKADACYSKALTLAPDTGAYKRNQGKNKAKWDADEVIEVGDDAGVRILKGLIKPAGGQKPPPTIGQYITGIALLLLFLGIIFGIIAAVMGGSNSTFTDDDRKFLDIMDGYIKETQKITNESNEYATKKDLKSMKEIINNGIILAQNTLEQISKLNLSPKMQPYYTTMKLAIDKYQLSNRRMLEGTESMENGGTGATAFAAATNDMEDYARLLTIGNEQLNELTK